MVSSFAFQRLHKFLPLLAALALLPTTTRANEIIATFEWQKLGPSDTVPVGLEIRMDLGGGGKWARLPPPPPEEDSTPTTMEQQDKQHQQQQQQQEAVPIHHKDRCGPSCKERQNERAERRRAAGFRLRGPRDSSSSISLNDIAKNIALASSLLRGGIFIVFGLLIGVGMATRLRTRRSASNGLHEH